MSLRFVRLTRPAIRKLQAGERITEQGISAERLEDGDIRYSVNIMVDAEAGGRRPGPAWQTSI